MSEPLYVTGIRICASLAACSLFASLSPDIRVVHQQKSTVSMPSALPVLSMLANCVAWGLYGLLITDYFPLVATNIVGLTFSLCYLVIYYQNEQCKDRLHLEILATILVLLGLVLYLFVAASEDVKEETIRDVVGLVAVTISLVMFGSPLVLVKRVIQERNTELLPLTMIIAGAVNCVLWLAYGLLLSNSFVIVPNAASLLLGVMQLLLFCVFPRGRTYDTVKHFTSNTKLQNEVKSGGKTKKRSEKATMLADTEAEASSVDIELEAKDPTAQRTVKAEMTIEVH